jgi:hypothetical protein
MSQLLNDNEEGSGGVGGVSNGGGPTIQAISTFAESLILTFQVRMAELEGHYEVSIRTPVTPPRWKEFDEELAAVWEGLLDALVAADKPRIAVAVLTFVYYWYNFMPLARGTAVCGHITLLSLFAVAGMPLTAKIPVVSASPPHPTKKGKNTFSLKTLIDGNGCPRQI